MKQFLKKITLPDVIFYSVIGLLFLLFSSVTICNMMDNFEPKNPERDFGNRTFNIVNEGRVCPSNAPTPECQDAWIVMGDVNKSMFNAIHATLQAHGASLPFCFVSAGGDIDMAGHIITLMQDYNATACLGDTYVVNDVTPILSIQDINGDTVRGNLCMSACSLIFTAVEQRVIFGEALVGVHNGRSVIDLCWCAIPISDPETPLASEEYDTVIAELSSEDQRERVKRLRALSEKVHSDTMRFLTQKEMQRIVPNSTTIEASATSI